MELNRIYNMECVEGMKTLIQDNQIDLTVTSPPYDNLRNYKGYSFDFENVAKELYRITKPGGTVVWIVNDATVKGSETGTSFRQALYFKDTGFNIHDTMIYKKRNPVPINAPRYQPSFEYMFVFTKGKIKTYNPLKVPCVLAGTKHHLEQRKEDGVLKQATGYGKKVKEDRPRHNVWEYIVGGGNVTKDKVAYEHPAIFPEQLAEDHILSWSNPGDVIFDPFMGSGTVAKISMINGRNWLGFEISKEYFEIANKRIQQCHI